MLIEASHISHAYPGSGGRKQVLEDVSLPVDEGQIVGLLGESGSGKSTLGQIMAGLLRPCMGQILWKGQSVRLPYRGELRRQVQILFQHPEVAFNPRWTLYHSMREAFSLCGKSFTETALCQTLESYGLTLEQLRRYPLQLSGGELQRLALARVLLMEPAFIVLDEPTSMLDVISQAQMMALLQQLRQQRGIAYLLITHDVQLCQAMCDDIYEISAQRLIKSEKQYVE